MPELSVAIFAADSDQRAILQVLVDGTSVARTVCANSTLPLSASDPVIRRTSAFGPDVILIDLNADGVTAALRAVELLHQELPASALFVIGPMTQPQLIVSAMRAGVREYIERPTTTTDLLESQQLALFYGLLVPLRICYRVCVATPTRQVLRWHLRIMMQPAAISGAVAKPNSSAPSNAPTTTSRPVRTPPSGLHRDAPSAAHYRCTSV